MRGSRDPGREQSGLRRKKKEKAGYLEGKQQTFIRRKLSEDFGRTGKWVKSRLGSSFINCGKIYEM